MLQLNNAGNNFTETALLNGVAATDWSWSALFAIMIKMASKIFCGQWNSKTSQ
jgi:hypothetical protein